MKCKRCGYINYDEAYFCRNCGGKMNPSKKRKIQKEKNKNDNEMVNEALDNITFGKPQPDYYDDTPINNNMDYNQPNGFNPYQMNQQNGFNPNQMNPQNGFNPNQMNPQNGFNPNQMNPQNEFKSNQENQQNNSGICNQGQNNSPTAYNSPNGYNQNEVNDQNNYVDYQNSPQSDGNYNRNYGFNPNAVGGYEQGRDFQSGSKGYNPNEVLESLEGGNVSNGAGVKAAVAIAVILGVVLIGGVVGLLLTLGFK